MATRNMHQQVYLLMPMDCATLVKAKSTIALPTEFNYQATSVS